jgi:Rrf2 family protein
MKLITRDTDYAIRALCFIYRRQDGTVPVERLVERLKVPRPFIRKIMQILTKEGILISHKGRGGGFALALRGDDITVISLLEIFQGPLKLSDHRFKKKLCHEIKRCPLKKRLDRIESYVRAELERITIAELVERGRV